MSQLVFQTLSGQRRAGEAKKVLRARLALGYIRHDNRRVGFPDLTFFPAVVQYQNTGFGNAKGDTVPIGPNWWYYNSLINSPDAQEYNSSIDLMLINRPFPNHLVPNVVGMQEPIGCGGAFFSIIDQTPTHVRVEAFPNNFDTRQLDPMVDNWYWKPWLFWKLCAIERNGTKVINVGKGGLDAYWMYIEPAIKSTRPAEIWFRRDKVDLLNNGETREYEFYGDGNVYENGKLLKRHGAVEPRSPVPQVWS